jgi:hypothetical protein
MSRANGCAEEPATPHGETQRHTWACIKPLAIVSHGKARFAQWYRQHCT